MSLSQIQSSLIFHDISGSSVLSSKYSRVQLPPPVLSVGTFGSVTITFLWTQIATAVGYTYEYYLSGVYVKGSTTSLFCSLQVPAYSLLTFRVAAYIDVNVPQTWCMPMTIIQSAVVTSTTPKASGTPISNFTPMSPSLAFDGSLVSFFDSNVSGQWIGLDLGSPKILTYIRYASRIGFPDRLPNGMFQVSNSITFNTFVTLFTITSQPTDNVLTSTPTFTTTIPYQYVRYINPGTNAQWLSIAEIEIYTL
jgi:F5/8 type C domain